MAISKDEANPMDTNVENSIREEKHRGDKRKYSISPSFRGLPSSSEFESTQVSDLQTSPEEDYEDLSSDKEEDTTEGEITDTHNSE
jgi:hypothetical protein